MFVLVTTIPAVGSTSVQRYDSAERLLEASRLIAATYERHGHTVRRESTYQNGQVWARTLTITVAK
jgi:hypothetical protein